MEKMLQVTKDGRLTCSGASQASSDAADSSDGPERRQRLKHSRMRCPSSTTIIKYGLNAETRSAVGSRINQIISRTPPREKRWATPEPKQHCDPPRPTHPFFLGKAAFERGASPKRDLTEAGQPVSSPPSRPSRKRALAPGRTRALTPGRSRAEKRNRASPCRVPLFESATAKCPAEKILGVLDASWPCKGMAHVHNFSVDEEMSSIPSSHSALYGQRKLKFKASGLQGGEDLIAKGSNCIQQWLKQPHLRSLHHPRQSSMRLPERLVATGADLQARVHEELRTPGANADDDEMEHAHPALKSLFDRLHWNLAPFDRGDCETAAWTQKHSPRCAAHVLQLGQEAVVLRDWLQTHIVVAVGGGADAGKPEDVETAKKIPRKERKKTEDDFVVSDGEDDEHGLTELSGPETSGSTPPGPIPPKSLVRASRARRSRKKNVVVLSGPHGCGKSATVYAVAEEMGFEVFEINSSSRRSGKDVQDRVGDMTENHLVNKTSTAGNVARAKHEAAQRKGRANPRAAESSSLMALFPSAAGSKPSQREPKAGFPRAECRRQKQSLILLEEVDVLFDEDQHFWTQVVKLATTSKRPIVITCNDESRVPMQDLPLHAILRLAPPPVDLATDYLLLLTAAEGHLLARKATRNLYEAKNRDLRASIAELNFWCQMSVGDQKGGLGWFHPRWPPEADTDAPVSPFRVVSKGTYQSGMGWLSHDAFHSRDAFGGDVVEEIRKEAWEAWGVGPQVWRRHHDVEAEESMPRGAMDAGAGDVATLRTLDAVAESLSATDVCCRVGLPFGVHEATDPSLPPVTDKERLNYVDASQVVQADRVWDYSGLSTKMAISSHRSIQRAFGRQQSSMWPQSEAAFIDAILAHKRERGMQRLFHAPFTRALDVNGPLTTSLPGTAPSSPLSLLPLDCTFRVVAQDVVPYVRAIVAHELHLEAERVRASSLRCEGGRHRHARTTRASRTALEGGRRETKRRERWFNKHLNRSLVMATASRAWSGLAAAPREAKGSEVSESFGDTDDEC